MSPPERFRIQIAPLQSWLCRFGVMVGDLQVCSHVMRALCFVLATRVQVREAESRTTEQPNTHKRRSLNLDPRKKL